jgi:aryl carrier-like protein
MLVPIRAAGLDTARILTDNEARFQLTENLHMDCESARAPGASRLEYLTQLWSIQLSRPAIDVHEDFFEAGGSSMQVIEMLTTVATQLGKDIDYAEFLKEPCIRKLDALLAD